MGTEEASRIRGETSTNWNRWYRTYRNQDLMTENRHQLFMWHEGTFSCKETHECACSHTLLCSNPPRLFNMTRLCVQSPSCRFRFWFCLIIQKRRFHRDSCVGGKQTEVHIVQLVITLCSHAAPTAGHMTTRSHDHTITWPHDHTITWYQSAGGWDIFVQQYVCVFFSVTGI